MPLIQRAPDNKHPAPSAPSAPSFNSASVYPTANGTNTLACASISAFSNFTPRPHRRNATAPHGVRVVSARNWPAASAKFLTKSSAVCPPKNLPPAVLMSSASPHAPQSNPPTDHPSNAKHPLPLPEPPHLPTGDNTSPPNTPTRSCAHPCGYKNTAAALCALDANTPPNSPRLRPGRVVCVNPTDRNRHPTPGTIHTSSSSHPRSKSFK